MHVNSGGALALGNVTKVTLHDVNTMEYTNIVDALIEMTMKLHRLIVSVDKKRTEERKIESHMIHGAFC
jgi:hypothetical protein